MGFLSRTFTNHRTAGEGGGGHISLTLHYHFYPLHGHLDISRAIIAESSLQTGSNWDPLVSERKSLTTKLRVHYHVHFLCLSDILDHLDHLKAGHLKKQLLRLFRKTENVLKGTVMQI